MKKWIDRGRARWSWFDLLMTIADKGGRDGVGRLSAVLSYYAFFSLFPLLLVATTILASLAIGDWGDKISESALANFPVIGDEIGKQTEQGAKSLRGLSWNTVFGGLAAVWAGTHAFEAYEQAMHVVYLGHAEKPVGFFWRRLRAVALMGILGLGAVATTALAGFVSSVGIPGLGKWAGIGITVLANALLMMLMFEVSVPGHQGLRKLLPGAVVGGALLTVLHLVGTWYLTKVVARATNTYGTFALTIGLLTWVNLIGKVVIWAAEINSVLAERTELREVATTETGLTESAGGPGGPGQAQGGE